MNSAISAAASGRSDERPSDVSDGTVGCMPSTMYHYLGRAAFDPETPRRMKEWLGLSLRTEHALLDDSSEFYGLIGQVDGVRIGISKDDTDRRRILERAFLQHLSNVALGLAPAYPKEPDIFGPLHATALKHEGFSLSGIHALIRVLGHLNLEAGERHHIFAPRGKGWDAFRIALHNGLTVTSDGIVIRQSLPETVLAALPGRPVSSLVDHPALRAFIIDSVDRQTNGILLRVSRLAEHT